MPSSVFSSALVLNPYHHISSRDGESSQAYAPKASSSKDASPSHTTAAAPHPIPASPPALASPPNLIQTTAQHSNREVDGFDEFDPRGSFSGKDLVMLGAVLHFIS